MNAIVILNILVVAKRSYIRDFKERIITDSFPLGMCFFIGKELSKHSVYDGNYDDIIKFIPEFCEGNINKAFDKLINLYKQKINENSL